MALTRDKIAHEALGLLTDKGLDGLSVRGLATRLGVQPPSLYWHFRNKEELLVMVSEAILAPLAQVEEPADGAWQEWLLTAAMKFRRALLSHRDGARVVAAAQSSQVMAEFSEGAMRVLSNRGVPLARARLLLLLVERFTLGLVLEEQTATVTTTLDPDEAARRYPLLTSAVHDYFKSGATLDDLYEESVRVILAQEASKNDV